MRAIYTEMVVSQSPARVHRDTAMHLQRAIVDEWRLQQFLPTEAANDGHTLPGAA